MTQVQPMPDPNRFEPINANQPDGLATLSRLDFIFVQQKVELLEAIVGCETNNRYVIRDQSGIEIFKAEEATDCCTRQWCGPLRPFELTVKTVGTEEPVIQISRPLACGDCCFPCCLQAISVFSPEGQLLGKVEQEWTFCIPKFIVKNAGEETVLRIIGPCCTLKCCSDVEFKIYSAKDGEVDGLLEVGKISKKWSGFTKEAFTDADTFGVSFPPGIDVSIKATLLGALFLIDFMYFEHSNQ